MFVINNKYNVKLISTEITLEIISDRTPVLTQKYTQHTIQQQTKSKTIQKDDGNC